VGLPSLAIRPYLPTLAVLVTGLLVVTCAFFWFRGQEEINQAAEFDRQAIVLHASVERGIQSSLQPVLSIAALWNAVPSVERAQFHAFVRSFLQEAPEIQALEWAPRISDSARASAELKAQRDGYPDFRISDRGSDGQLIPAAERLEYFPVYYIEPWVGNHVALGFDLASEPIRRAVLEQARDSGIPKATAGITLVQETGTQAGFLYFVPVYAAGFPHDTVEERRESLVGFALGVYRIGNLVDIALRGIDRTDAILDVYDVTIPESPTLLYSQTQQPNAPAVLPTVENRGEVSLLGHTDTFDVGGRRWALVSVPSARYLAAHRVRVSWAILAAGLAIVFFGASAIFVRSRSAYQLERVNAALHEANSSLTQANRKTELLLNTAGEGIFGVSRDGKVIFVNEAAANLLGTTSSGLLGRVRPDFTLPGWPEARSSPDNALYRVLEDSVGDELLNSTFWRFDGTAFPVQFVTRPTREQGELIGATITFSDITRRKQAEEAEQRAIRVQGQLEGVRYAARELAHSLNNALSLPTAVVDLVKSESTISSSLRDMACRAATRLELARDCVRQLQQVVRVETKDTVVGTALDVEQSAKAPASGASPAQVPDPTLEAQDPQNQSSRIAR